MPVKITKVTQPDSRILYYDPRRHPIDEEDPNAQVGYNGHVVLLFNGPDLTIEYRDIVKNDLLFVETFTSTESGTFEHSFSKPPTSALLSGELPR